MTRFRLPAFIPRRWQLRDIRRARLTRWVLMAGVLVMLGMQTAIAAYACTMPSSASGPASAMGTMGDASMPTSCSEMAHAVANAPLCQKHCTPDASAPTAAHALSVPPNLLAALPPDSPVLPAHVQAALEIDARHRRHPPGPPASLLFCSLLI